MAKTANEKLVRGVFEAIRAKDFAAMPKFFAPDVIVHISGRNPFSGDYKGIEEFAAFIQRITEATGDSMEFEVHDVCSSDTHAVALIQARVSRGGKSLSWNRAIVYHIEGGKIVEAWPLESNQQGLDELLA